MQQYIRKFDEDRIMLNGQPFLFSISTLAGAGGYIAGTQLNLDGVYLLDLDGDGVPEPSPFMNQELFITAMKIVNSSAVPPAGNVFAGLQIDGKLVLSGSEQGGGPLGAAGGLIQHLPGDTIYLDSMAKMVALAPTAITGTDIYGSSLSLSLSRPIICRTSIRLWAGVQLPQPADTTTLWLRGFNVPRRQ